MPSDLPTICQERARLLRQYSDAVRAYAGGVSEMADFALAGDEVRANEMRRIGRTAWDEAEKARLILYRHEADHGCVNSANVRNIAET